MGGGDCADASGAVTINIRCSNGSKFTVQTSLDATVASFKEIVSGNSAVPAELQRLIYKGRILKDDQTLESYGLEADHTVHLVRGASPSASVNPPASTGVNAGTATNPTNTNAAGPGGAETGGLGGAGLGGSPFPGVGGMFGGGLQEMNQMHQQLMQNPNMMRDILNMPAMQNIMNNPDLMRNMFMNNPQTREIIDRNPDLAHILNDPSILRQTLEAARNPELMREMMRNTDRAMSNIESSPEGFNMLRRMYENVQEPFLNATTMTGDSATDPGSNPFAALLGNQGAARARDPSQNPSTEVSDGSPIPNTNPLPNPWNSAAGAGQTNGTGPTPVGGDARTPGIAGLGGLGFPDMEQMLGGNQDSAPLNRMLENPVMMQMMQSLLSNPQYMNQILSNLDPSGMLGSNTQIREMLQNPQFIQQLTSPATLQQLRSLQQSFSPLGPQQQGQAQNETGTGGTGTPNNMGMDMLMNMFSGGLGGAGLGVPNTTSNVPPEQRYATQLSQLQEMGFFDTQENIRALSATSGNVHAAVERLLGNLGQ